MITARFLTEAEVEALHDDYLAHEYAQIEEFEAEQALDAEEEEARLLEEERQRSGGFLPGDAVRAYDPIRRQAVSGVFFMVSPHVSTTLVVVVDGTLRTFARENVSLSA